MSDVLLKQTRLLRLLERERLNIGIEPKVLLIDFLRNGHVSGVDGRRDIFEFRSLPSRPAIPNLMLQPEQTLMRARGVAMALHVGNLESSDNGWLLPTQREDLKLCPHSRLAEKRDFSGQRRYAGMCATAMLLSPNYVLTAGHAVNQQSAADLAFVFGYLADSEWRNEDPSQSPPYEFTTDQVFHGARFAFLSTSRRFGDFAIIELADAVPETVAVPLPLAPRDSALRMAPVSMLGHPRGLPMKAVAGVRTEKVGAIIWELDCHDLYTNLDSFQHNSGSPVMNADGQVLGLMVGTDEGDIKDGCTLAGPELPGTARVTRVDQIYDVLLDHGAVAGTPE